MNAIATSVIACGSSSRAIESLTAEFQAGDCNAVHTPSTKVNHSKVAGPTLPAKAKPVSSKAVSA